MNRIHFTVNGVQHSVGCEVDSNLTLLDYLRSHLKLFGTKYMCREAGCGVCIVSVIQRPGALSTAVNTCMVSVRSCKGWEITTIECLGNRLKGYDELQKGLAYGNGSQCGYCSSGWVMAMHSLSQSKKKLTMLEIEKSFGSNICRCTGYRPILEFFKKFACDAPKSLNIEDIEDLQICNRKADNCAQNCIDQDWCFVSENDLHKETVLYIKLQDNRDWYRVESVRDIFKILKNKDDSSYMLVAGNTAKANSIGKRILSMLEYLKENMRGKVIINVLLQPMNPDNKLVTYKIMPRAQNAHAIVNAGFLYKLQNNSKVSEARLVFGGLSPEFNRAKATEQFLTGKNLFTNETLQAAIQILDKELVVTENPPEPFVAYRKQLAIALFYKVGTQNLKWIFIVRLNIFIYCATFCICIPSAISVIISLTDN